MGSCNGCVCVILMNEFMRNPSQPPVSEGGPVGGCSEAASTHNMARGQRTLRGYGVGLPQLHGKRTALTEWLGRG